MIKQKVRLVIFFVVVIGFLLPYSIKAEEVIAEVLLVIRPGEILAFSGPQDHWVTENFKIDEKIIEKRSHGNVAVVFTNLRILGFSVFSDKWAKEDLFINERLKDIQAEGNIATIVTDKRVFAYNAHTGKWVEAK